MRGLELEQFGFLSLHFFLPFQELCEGKLFFASGFPRLELLTCSPWDSQPDREAGDGATRLLSSHTSDAAGLRKRTAAAQSALGSLWNCSWGFRETFSVDLSPLRTAV